MMTGVLQGQVALVTGGSRGVGKGIAQELGSLGSTVYVTGRTVAQQDFGDVCIAVVCDHADDHQTEGVFNRISDERGQSLGPNVDDWLFSVIPHMAFLLGR